MVFGHDDFRFPCRTRVQAGAVRWWRCWQDHFGEATFDRWASWSKYPGWLGLYRGLYSLHTTSGEYTAGESGIKAELKKKVGLYRGWNPTAVIYRDYFINHDIRGPVFNQPVAQVSSRRSIFQPWVREPYFWCREVIYREADVGCEMMGRDFFFQ